MNRYWSAIWRAVNAVPPAMRGRIIRHVLTLLAGAGLIRGLTADQANAWQGLVEMGLSAVGFVLAVYLSQRSDAKQLAKVTDPLTDAEIDAIVREVCKDQPTNLAGRTDAAFEDLRKTIESMPDQPVPKYPTGEKGHKDSPTPDQIARKPQPTPAPPPAPNRGGGQ